MYKLRQFLMFLIPLTWVLLVSACDTLDLGLSENDKNATPTPTLPALLPEVARGYMVVNNASCLAGQYIPITTDKKQGDLMAWQPGSHQLAYVSPLNNSWAWYLGKLSIASPDENKTVFEDENIKVFGDLAWSPDASTLAFVTLQNNNFFSVTLIQPDNSQTVDLFPGEEARTDELSGKKAIEGWINNRQISVSSSCGIDCAQMIRFNNDGSGKQVLEEIRPVDDHSYDLSLHQIEFEEGTYPAMTDPNWSPDNTQVFYTDEDDDAWVLDVPGKTQYQLGWLGDYVRETKWSSDSQLLAIRMDNQINVYKTKCK
ncbi:MAG: hypothetical protein LWX83_12225 [Anaerolineae bacterium]|nr:hypothetical protein [Anaerolineae bacterium]